MSTSKLSFIFRTDVHASDRSPASWKGDYPAEIWSNLEQIGELARTHEVVAVLDGGDYFHVKTASKTTHALVRKTALIHQAYPCPTYSIEGNHDLSYNNVDSLERQPLGVIYSAGVFRNLREEVFEGGGVRVRVVGVPYTPDLTLEELLKLQKKPGDTHLIALVHALASEDPPPSVQEFFGEPVFRYADLASESGPDVWCFGHWHKDQGIVHVGGKTFVNLGAVSRGALVSENLRRTPKVALIELGSKVEVTPIPLNVLPAEEVFDLERKAKVEAKHRGIDEFITRLVTDAHLDPTKDVRENIEGIGSFAKNVRDRALKYLDLAEGG